jgi:formylglycine-generating enzyme required for sulfatase activity
MKSLLLIIAGIVLSLVSYSKDPEDNNSGSDVFALVPKGTYTIQNGLSIKIVSIDEFRMSNEITNKEFREFYLSIMNTPNDTISWINYSKINSLNRSGRNDDSRSIVEKSAYSDILPNLISFDVWDTLPLCKFYFYNPKYDNFPVVGVTCQGAMFFCLWKTNKANKNSPGKKNSIIVEYRLPTEFEWEYAATFKVIEKADKRVRALHPIYQGDKNELGLYNLASNVSEWTCSSENSDRKSYHVVKGSSWKSNPDANTRQLIDQAEPSKYIGFRIVCINKTSK